MTQTARPKAIAYAPSSHSLANRLGRAAWGLTYALLYRPSPRPAHAWRRWLLRMFGAKVGRGAHPYPGAKIWAPWNLELGADSSLADGVDCYCVDRVRIGNRVTVSQYSFLCTATHDYEDPSFRLVSAPIVVGDEAWICADVFVGPGVAVGEGAVIGARSTVFADIASWQVAAGTPAKVIKPRVIRDAPGA